MIRVLDSHALLAFLEKQPGYEKVRALLVSALESQTFLLMTSVNYGEVYYITMRECGREKAEEIERIVRTLPIEIVEADWPLAREAARIKAAHKMSYADCFAAALAKSRRGEVVTGDREFEAVEGEIRIVWINKAVNA
jgi:ribonuclease VapC